MNQFNFTSSRRRKFAAAVIAAIAIVQILVGVLSDKFMGAAVIAFSIDLAFIPGPPLTLRFSEIYALARSGWRASWGAKILGAVGFVLLATGIYLKWQGR